MSGVIWEVAGGTCEVAGGICEWPVGMAGGLGSLHPSLQRLGSQWAKCG